MAANGRQGLSCMPHVKECEHTGSKPIVCRVLGHIVQLLLVYHLLYMLKTSPKTLLIEMSVETEISPDTITKQYV